MDPHNITVIDTHAHLCDPVFEKDILEVLQRAEEAGISAVVSIGETLADARRNLELARNHHLIRPAAGLYPTVLDMKEANSLISLIRKEREKLVAIGEVGLDYWAVNDERERELQRRIFNLFIDLSLEFDLPLNVHSRSAGKQAISMLLERGAEKVQLHAFDGRASSAMPGVEAGFFFSVPPSVIRSRQKQKLIKQLPLSSLLIETDSPVLGPSREERNEPVNALKVLNALSELKGLSQEEVSEAALHNTHQLYGDLRV